MPCQEDYEAYIKCCKEYENTRDMVDCETITYKFRQCMEKHMNPPKVEDSRQETSKAK